METSKERDMRVELLIYLKGNWGIRQGPRSRDFLLQETENADHQNRIYHRTTDYSEYWRISIVRSWWPAWIFHLTRYAKIHIEDIIKCIGLHWQQKKNRRRRIQHAVKSWRREGEDVTSVWINDVQYTLSKKRETGWKIVQWLRIQKNITLFTTFKEWHQKKILPWYRSKRHDSY